MKRTSDITIGERLRELRKSRKKSVEVVSGMIGVTEASWLSWEHGERLPNLKYVLLIIDFFDVSADWLLGLTDSKKGAGYHD